MDLSNDPFLGTPISMEEVESGVDPSMAWLDMIDWEMLQTDTNDTSNYAQNAESHGKEMASVQTENNTTTAMKSAPTTETVETETQDQSSTLDHASTTALQPQASFDSSPHLTPTISSTQEVPEIDTDLRGPPMNQTQRRSSHNFHGNRQAPNLSFLQPYSPGDHLISQTGYDLNPLQEQTFASSGKPNNKQTLKYSSNAAGAFDTLARDFPKSQSGFAYPSQESIHEANCIDQLVSAFKDVVHSENREQEVEWIQKQSDSKIKGWCEETLQAILARQSGNKPLCPGLSKRSFCQQHPNYKNFDARFAAVVKVLETEKRACKRFQRDHGWSKRLADDPVYEHAAIVSNDEGNSARAVRDQQKKNNSVAILQGWERVLAGEILTREEVQNYISLAEYNVDNGKKRSRVESPVQPQSGRGKKARRDFC